MVSSKGYNSSDPKKILRILVTGATGFVGSHVVRGMLDAGHEVVGVDLDLEKLKRCPHLSGIMHHPKCHWIPLNLSNIVRDQGVLNRYVFDGVIHCASQQPRKDYTFDSYYKGNVQLLLNLLDAMLENNIKKIIYFSTASVYADSIGTRLDEGSQVNPSNYYAISKYASEQVLKYRSLEDGLESICFRMPSVIGPWQEGGLVHTYYENAKRNNDFEIYSEGRLLRNVIHVDDVLQACQKALVKLNGKKGYNLYLLGSSNSLSMEQIARYIVKRMDSKSVIKTVKKQAPVNFHWNLCINKMSGELGLAPKSIEEHIDTYIKQMGELNE